MARRIRKASWGTSLLRSFGALTRTTLRSGTRAAAKAARKIAKQAARPKVAKKAARPKAVKRAARPKVPKRAAPLKSAKRAAPRKAAKRIAKTARSIVAKTAKPLGDAPGWSSGVAVDGATARRYRLYRPPALDRAAPLLVMLHGCHQNADHFERSARLHRLALREGFCVLYPDQDRLANAQGCWNWYETRSGRAFGEAAAILAQVDQLCERQIADARRVAVAGLSAGASMAALLGMRYPQRFRAVAMHSGIGPGAAHSSAQVIGAMRARRLPSLQPAAADEPALPPLLVIQGNVDAIVRAGNGRAIAHAWAERAGARALPTRTLQRGQRYPSAVTDFKLGTRIVASLCEVQGLGHAWSGGAAGLPFSDAKGPDATRMIWAFAARQFRGLR